MRNMTIRKSFAGPLASLIMMTPGFIRAAQTDENGPGTDRLTYQKDFPEKLARVAGGPLILSAAETNPAYEAMGLADQQMAEIIDALAEKCARLKKYQGTSAYRKVARAELTPEAPLGHHCLWGLMSEINKLGIVSDGSQKANVTFRSEIIRRYKGPEYAGSLHTNVTVYKNKQDLENKMRRIIANARGGAKDTAAIVARFRKNNIHIDDLGRGCVFLLPGTTTPYHAVFYPGRGTFDDHGKFMPDDREEPACIAFNNEHLSELFSLFGNGNTIYVPFIADVHKISTVSLMIEGKKFYDMSRDDLIAYLIDGMERSDAVAAWLRDASTTILIGFAFSKFYGNEFIRAEELEQLPPRPVPVSRTPELIARMMQYTM